MTHLRDEASHAGSCIGTSTALWARVGHVVLSAIGPAGFPVCESLSMLTPFLAAPGDVDWHITIRACAGPEHFDNFSERTRLTLFPATDVISRRHPDGSVWFESEGMTVLIAPASRTATLYLPCPMNPQVPRFGALMVIEILRHERIHLIHAAAVEVNGQGILIVAPSGGGKSTLASVWAASRSARFMADDRCFLWRSGEEIVCQGIATPVGLCQASEQILSRNGHRLSHNRPPERSQEKILYDAQIEFGPIHRQPTPIKAIVLLTPDLAADHPVTPVSASKVYQSLLRGGLYIGEPQVMKSHLDLIADLMDRALLLAAPTRPHYPEILVSLNRCLENQSQVLQERHRLPPPDLTASQARQCAVQLNGLLLGTEMQELLQGYHEEQWRPLLKLAEHHGLLASLGFELRRNRHLANLPEGLHHVVTSAMRTSEAGRLLHTRMLCRIAEKLDATGIRWCVMKGPAIAERFFDPPSARAYGDLDIIVPFQCRQQAAEALRPLGFGASEINNRLKNAANRGEWVLIAHEPARYTVELHWDYITGGSLRRFVSCDLTEVLERRVFVNVNGMVVPMTSAADQLLSCCVHAIYGHGLGSLRQLLDIALIWCRCSSEERETTLRSAAQLGIVDAVVISLRRAEALFPGRVKRMETNLPSIKLSLAIARLFMPQDATIRPWTKSNRLRGKLLRMALRQRWI